MVSLVGRSSTARSGPAFPALHTVKRNSVEAKAGTVRKSPLTLLRVRPTMPQEQHVPRPAPCQGLSKGKANSGCCVWHSPASTGTTSTREKQILLHLGRTVLSWYETPKLKHIIPYNLEKQK